MDFGIVLGALLTVLQQDRFVFTRVVTGRSLTAAVVGGVLLGYGARISHGCNIGAFFSGISSGSVHGWVWFLAAYTGNVAGTRMRPFFALPSTAEC